MQWSFLRNGFLCASGALLAIGLPARGETVLSENFNNISAFQGTYGTYGPGGPSAGTTSDAWNPTYYATINNGDGWTFNDGTQYATNGDATHGQATDGALLLNERGVGGLTSNTSPLATIGLSNLTIGETYTVSFKYWGDNEPSESYTLTSYINSALVYSVNGIDGAPASNPAGHVGSYTFLATSGNEILGFGQVGNVDASPILDDITVSAAAPLPSVAWGGLSLLCSIGLLTGLRTKHVASR